MDQFDIGQRAFVRSAHVRVDDLLNRQRSLYLEVTDHQRGAGSFAEQFDELAIENINLQSQFFERHFILVIRELPAASFWLLALRKTIQAADLPNTG